MAGGAQGASFFGTGATGRAFAAAANWFRPAAEETADWKMATSEDNGLNPTHATTQMSVAETQKAVKLEIDKSPAVDPITNSFLPGSLIV